MMERLVLLGYTAGWRLVRLLPERAAYRLFELIADVAWWRRGPGVRRLEANLARAVPDADEARLRELSRAGMRSYLRYWCESFRLPSWSRARIVEGKRLVGREHLDAALAAGRGVVGFLGHLGNWDHAGAWSGLEYAKVTTVAERLRPEELFDAFVAYREQLGMEILALTPRSGSTGGEDVFARLKGTLEGGGFVPLLADRDLTHSGVSVQLLGEEASVAAGPAALALATGAVLLPVMLHYEQVRPGPSGWRSVFVVHPPVPEPADGTREEKLQAMTQACADRLSETVRAHPADWHMLQKVFTRDLR
ncbi:phosphatidylinositol mannoside acyltransferase [Spongisporangium articulatum]|uniref:Phosphatidylinositol mannoside acyltransferase n=1 Tax=Spongisporangium articulatum TaxID=3362603 RepID=A0ABW8ATC1_9ACTN